MKDFVIYIDGFDKNELLC